MLIKKTMYDMYFVNVVLDSGYRRRRSADERVATTLRFVVGEDGECKNAQPNGYCNGELKPGTSYR